MSPPRTFVDDNFGTWDIENQDDIDFYFQVQRESRRKKCQGCGRMVKLRPDYAYCNSCADARERGGDF